MCWSRTINPRSKSTWGCFGVDSQKPFLTRVMASGSSLQHLILTDAAALYKDKHQSVFILLFFYNNCLWIPVYVGSSDSLLVVIVPLMKVKKTPKIPMSAIYKPLSVIE